MTRCMDCNFVICQCFGRDFDGGRALQESAAQSCLPPTNVINVEFRSDARRIAELENRIAALEARLDEQEKCPVATWGYPYPPVVGTINWTCP